MPYLDVSRVLTDPRFAQKFDVIRREQKVNSFGETEIPAPEPICGVVGVICDASKDDLARMPEYQRMGRNISVVTKFRLYGPAVSTDGKQFDADQIRWLGDSFVVKAVFPYTAYGAGFVQAIAGSIDSIDRLAPSKPQL